MNFYFAAFPHKLIYQRALENLPQPPSGRLSDNYAGYVVKAGVSNDFRSDPVAGNPGRVGSKGFGQKKVGFQASFVGLP